MEQTNGNLILVGESGMVGERRSVGYVLGVDSAGNVLWEHKYQAQQNDYGSYLFDAERFDDNHLLLMGRVYATSNGGVNTGRAIMIDSTGEVVWLADYPDLTQVTCGTMNSNGDIILAGIGDFSSSVFVGGTGIYIFQIDSLGYADFSEINDYVGVKNSSPAPSFKSIPTVMQALEYSPDGSFQVDFFNLQGQKITNRLNMGLIKHSESGSKGSGMVIARMKKENYSHSATILRIK